MLPLTEPDKGFAKIQRGLQALNPDATDTEGEWWAKNSLPLTFPKSPPQPVASLRFFPQIEQSGSVAQLDRAVPS